MPSQEVQPVVLTTPGRDPGRVTDIAAALRGVPGIAEPIVHSDEPRAGAAMATRDAILRAGERGGHVLFVEDDVEVHPEAARRVAAVEFPTGVAVVSFCDMREVPEFSPAGLYRRSPLASDGRGWWGNQALLIHRETVEMCRQQDWFGPQVEDSDGVRVHKATYDDQGRNCSDVRLAMLVHLFGGERRDYAVYVPSVFRHVGQESMCFPGRGIGERETRNWLGDRLRFAIDAQLAAERAERSPFVGEEADSDAGGTITARRVV